MNQEISKRAHVPVPSTMAEWVRKSGLNRTINDLVEDIHSGLLGTNAQYRSYLDAVYDEQAAEGSLAADNVMAARIIREEAEQRNIPQISAAKLATIVKALNIVLRRYGLSRNERRNTLNGEIVPTGNGGD